MDTIRISKSIDSYIDSYLEKNINYDQIDNEVDYAKYDLVNSFEKINEQYELIQICKDDFPKEYQKQKEYILTNLIYKL